MSNLTYTQQNILEALQEGGIKTYEELAKLLPQSDSKKAVGVVISIIRNKCPHINIYSVVNVGYYIAANQRSTVCGGVRSQVLCEIEKGPVKRLDLQSKFWPGSDRKGSLTVDSIISRLRTQNGAIITVKGGIVKLEGWSQDAV